MKFVVALVLLSTSVAAQPRCYPEVVLGDSPAAYFRLGESSGTTTTDVTDAGRLATVPPSVQLGVAGAIAGDSNTAARFSASAEIASADAMSIGPDTTLEAWFRAADGGVAGGPFVALVNSSNLHSRELKVENDRVGGVVRSDSNWTLNAVQSSAASRTAWTHVVFTVENHRDLKLYVDGALIGSRTIATPTSDFTTPLNIGGAAQSFLGKFGGDVDEVAIYNHALSGGRVLAHLQAAQLRTAIAAEGEACCYDAECIFGTCAQRQCVATAGATDGGTVPRGEDPSLYAVRCGGAPLMFLLPLALLRRRTRGKCSTGVPSR